MPQLFGSDLHADGHDQSNCVVRWTGAGQEGLCCGMQWRSEPMWPNGVGGCEAWTAGNPVADGVMMFVPMVVGSAAAGANFGCGAFGGTVNGDYGDAAASPEWWPLGGEDDDVAAGAGFKAHRGSKERSASRSRRSTRARRQHALVPRRVNLEERSRDRPTEKLTTLMVRNVPNNYNRAQLMQELDDLGFHGKYDFLYLPIDSATTWNVGYAFVNFECPEDAALCMRTMSSYSFQHPRHGRNRPAQVSYAHVQGLDLNLAHCSGTSLFSGAAAWQRPWVKRRQKKQPGEELCSKAEAVKEVDTPQEEQQDLGAAVVRRLQGRKQSQGSALRLLASVLPPLAAALERNSGEKFTLEGKGAAGCEGAVSAEDLQRAIDDLRGGADLLGSILSDAAAGKRQEVLCTTEAGSKDRRQSERRRALGASLRGGGMSMVRAARVPRQPRGRAGCFIPWHMSAAWPPSVVVAGAGASLFGVGGGGGVRLDLANVVVGPAPASTMFCYMEAPVVWTSRGSTDVRQPFSDEFGHVDEPCEVQAARVNTATVVVTRTPSRTPSPSPERQFYPRTASAADAAAPVGAATAAAEA